MRVLIIAIIVIGLIAIFINVQAKKVDFYFHLDNLGLSTLFHSGQKYATATIGIDVSNNGLLSVNISDIQAKAYHGGQLLVKTIEGAADETHVITAKATTTIQQNVQVYLTDAVLLGLNYFTQPGPLRIDYVVSFKLYGLPFTNSDHFMYNK